VPCATRPAWWSQRAGDDRQRERRDDDELREALAGVLRIRQPGAVAHIGVAAEQDRELDGDERCEHSAFRAPSASSHSVCPSRSSGRRAGPSPVRAACAKAAGERDESSEDEEAQRQVVERGSSSGRNVARDLRERPVAAGEEGAEDRQEHACQQQRATGAKAWRLGPCGSVPARRRLRGARRTPSVAVPRPRRARTAPRARRAHRQGAEDDRGDELAGDDPAGVAHAGGRGERQRQRAGRAGRTASAAASASATATTA